MVFFLLLLVFHSVTFLSDLKWVTMQHKQLQMPIKAFDKKMFSTYFQFLRWCNSWTICNNGALRRIPPHCCDCRLMPVGIVMVSVGRASGVYCDSPPFGTQHCPRCPAKRTILRHSPIKADACVHGRHWWWGEDYYQPEKFMFILEAIPHYLPL